MYDLIVALNESLGKLSKGSSEFKEVVKALLKMNKRTSVTPNSNIANFTVSDVSEVPSKVMQIVSNTGENAAAVYLENAEGKGVIVFNKYGDDFSGKITKMTQIEVITRNNSPWSFNGFDHFRTQDNRRGAKDYRFRDIATFDMRGKISGAVIFSDLNKAQLRDDRRLSRINDDPLSLEGYDKVWDRTKRLKAYKASKGVNFPAGEISFKQFSDLIVSGYSKQGVRFKDIPVQVYIVNNIKIPKNPANDYIVEVAHLDALEDGVDSAGRVYGRSSTLARVNMDLSTGRFIIKSR